MIVSSETPEGLFRVSQFDTSMGMVKDISFAPKCDYLGFNSGVANIIQDVAYNNYNTAFCNQGTVPMFPPASTLSGFTNISQEKCAMRCPQNISGVGNY